MAITFDCDRCGRRHRVRDEAAGKRTKCKGCGCAIGIPTSTGDQPLNSKRTRARTRSASVPVPTIVVTVALICGTLAVIALALHFGSQGAAVSSEANTAQRSEANTWKQYTFIDRIKIEMPGIPVHVMASAYEHHQRLRTRGYACMVAYVRLSSGLAETIDVEEWSEGLIESMRERHHIRSVVSEEKVTHGGLTGTQVTCRGTNSLVTLRLFLADELAIGLEFSTPEGKPQLTVMNRFFDSLEILPPPAPDASPERIASLIGQLDDPSKVAQQEAVSELARTGDDRAVAALVRLLKVGRLEYSAKKALQSMGTIAETAVLELLESSDSDVRKNAAQVLEDIGTFQSIEALGKAAKDSDTLVSISAKNALRAIKTRGGSQVQ